MVSIDADKIGTVDETTGKTVKVDLDRQLLKPLAGSGKMFCYDSPEYVKDMGTPARFHQVEEDYKAGRVSAKNLSNKQKAMFLDRDGTINKYVGFLRNIDDFELIDTSEEEYDCVLDTNTKGMYFISQEIIKYMISNHISGNILNIVSSSAIRPGTSPYIISKWGERSLTLGMAKKYLPYGIIVNGLAPGSTLTPMLCKNSDNLDLEYSPSGRYAAPEEIGNLATILVSEMGRMIVGDVIYATGGAGIITIDDTAY